MGTGMIYGYIRVSKTTQDFEAQRSAIIDFAATKTLAYFQTHGLKPKFGFELFTFHMNMTWLITV